MMYSDSSDSSDSSSLLSCSEAGSSRKLMPDVHVPMWTTPGWKDDAASRSGTDYAVHDPVKDVVRPMMLDTDKAKNPSIHAVRFGIFPGRSDGRSCTSPTRSTAQLIKSRDLSGRNISRGELTTKLQELARKRRLHMDDYLASHTSRTLQKDGHQEREYLKAFDELLIEEFWQGCLFGDMTMDELLAGNYFEMGDFQSNLSGPIHSLFSREKWDQSPFGIQDVSTVFFDLDKTHKTHETHETPYRMEPESSDEVWGCLQPTIQIATRLFCQDDPFFKAILDVRNWYKMPPTGDQDQRTSAPIIRIEVRNDNSEAIGYKHNVRPSTTFDPVALTFRVLEQRLRWRIVNAHYDIGPPIGEFEAETGFGTTRFNLSNSNTYISIDIAADIVWQLLAPQLSSSEKTMISWMLSSTMVHEMCHSIIAATLLWIRYPDKFGITDPTDLEFCAQLMSDLYVSDSQYDSIEPYYKSDSTKEIGEAFARHILGQGPYPMSHLSFYKPIFLSFYGGLTSSFDQSDEFPIGAAQDKVPAPFTLGERSFTFNHHSTVQTFFTQAFWNTTFKKYGSAALKSVPANPSKVAWFSAVESITFDTSLGDLTFGSLEFRKRAKNFIGELHESGQQVIAQYIKALIYDAWQFPMLAKRFVELAENWYYTGRRLAGQVTKTRMIALEAAIFFLFKNGRIDASKKKGEAKIFHAQWQKLRGHRCVEPDEISMALKRTVDQFMLGIIRAEDAYDKRISKSLMIFSQHLHQELCIQEAMVAQLYELPVGFWGHYIYGIPGHQMIWRTRTSNIIMQLTRLLRDLNGLQAHLPSWRNEWQAKILSWLSSFRNILTLISRDAREVHVNWREMLHTVPMLRKSRRKVWERWYFLAKRAMLNLKGEQLTKLEEFEQLYSKEFDLNRYKIVLPSRSANAQGIAEKWAGLLDNIVEFEQDESKLMEELGREEIKILASIPLAADIATTMDPKVHGQHRAQQLRQEVEIAKQKGRKLRLDRANAYCQEAYNKSASTHRIWAHQLQEARQIRKTPFTLDSANEPQITRALMEDHPAPYTGSQNKKKRDRDDCTSSLGIFDAPVRKKRYAVLPHKIDSLPELMAEVNKTSNDNVHMPAGRTPKLISRNIQISGDVLEELAESVQQDVNKMQDSDEAVNSRQTSQMFASEIQHAMKEHRETLNEVVKHQKRAHELAQEERDKAAELQHEEGA